MNRRDLKVYTRNELQTVLQERIDRISRSAQSLSRESDHKKRPHRMLEEDRQNILRAAERQIVSDATPPLSIFISYSGVGKELGDVAKRIANEFALHVKTGFDSEIETRFESDDDKENSLPHAIMNQIISCNCFLGIWSEDFDATNRPGLDMRGNMLGTQSGYVPSVWMPFELGVAASHGMPFRLLVVSGMHRLYYEKPFHFQSQVVFQRHEFEAKAKRVIQYLANKLKARRRRDT